MGRLFSALALCVAVLSAGTLCDAKAGGGGGGGGKGGSSGGGSKGGSTGGGSKGGSTLPSKGTGWSSGGSSKTWTSGSGFGGTKLGKGTSGYKGGSLAKRGSEGAYRPASALALGGLMGMGFYGYGMLLPHYHYPYYYTGYRNTTHKIVTEELAMVKQNFNTPNCTGEYAWGAMITYEYCDTYYEGGTPVSAVMYALNTTHTRYAFYNNTNGSCPNTTAPTEYQDFTPYSCLQNTGSTGSHRWVVAKMSPGWYNAAQNSQNGTVRRMTFNSSVQADSTCPSVATTDSIATVEFLNQCMLEDSIREYWFKNGTTYTVTETPEEQLARMRLTNPTYVPKYVMTWRTKNDADILIRGIYNDANCTLLTQPLEGYWVGDCFETSGTGSGAQAQAMVVDLAEPGATSTPSAANEIHVHSPVIIAMSAVALVLSMV